MMKNITNNTSLDDVLKVSTTKSAMTRANLTGKFPHIKHLPAPKTKLKLSKATHKKMLEAMILV